MAALFAAVVGCTQPEGPKEPTKEPVAEDGDPIEMTDFTVTLTNLHSGDVFFTIEPKQEDMTYWYSLQIKEDVAEADADIYASDLAYFQYVCDYYGLTMSELLSDNLVSGDVEWRYNGLTANTEYTLYMYGLDTQANALTEVNRLTFTTRKVEPIDCDFEIVVGDNVTATQFSITIVPSDDTVGYYFDVFPAAMYEEYCLSDAANIPAFLEEYIAALASENSLSVPTTVGYISNYGALTEDFTQDEYGIQASNTYYVFAVGIGADGTCTTEPAVVAVTTAAPPVNTFEVMESSVEDDRARFYVVPDHSESYVALFELQEYMYDNDGNALTDDEIIDAILRAQGDYIGNHMYSGTASIEECPLIPNKDYYCLVFGFFGGEVTTPLTKVAFKTKPADESNCEFIITLGTPKTDSCAVSFDPYLTPTPHMFGCMPYSTYEEYGANDDAVKRFNDELIDSLWDPKKMSREEWLSRALETSYNSWTIEGLEPNTQYLVYVIGLVPDGTYTTAAFTKTFTTKEVKVGPHLKEVLFNKQGKSVSAWFYLDTDTVVSMFKMSHIINDDSIYNLSDSELLAYLEEEHDTTYVNDVSNQTYFTVYDNDLTSGDVIYYAGAVFDPEGAYTIIRTTYEYK